MRTRTLFSLETPYREPFVIKGYEFGDEDAEPCAAVVGSLRGNEVQQTFICASVVRRLKELEHAGMLDERKRVLVVPAANSFSMNISERFWPLDKTDVNRMFPGYDQGETTQRIADGLFRAVQDYEYGIQLCSYFLPGDFVPHVRVTDTGCLDSEETRELCQRFGLPYALLKEATPFDTTTLNYNWQVWDTHAFSVYSSETDRIDTPSAEIASDAVMRFLHAVGATIMPVTGALETVYGREAALANVRTSKAGFFRLAAQLGEQVRPGDILAEILSTADCSVVERLTAPVAGRVFFHHVSSLVNAETIAFKIFPSE